MRLHLYRYLYVFICIIYPSDHCVSSFFTPSLHSAVSSHGHRNEQRTPSSSHLSKDEDTVGEVQLRLRRSTNLRSSASKEFTNKYENDDSPTSNLVFDTASRIVQCYLSSSEDVTNEPWSSRSLLRRITEDDLTTNTSDGYWAEMFAPLYRSAISLNKISPPSIPKNENRKPQQPRKRRKGHRTNLKLTIAYRGRDFCGWEDQRHSILDGGNSTQVQLPSVQGMLVDILDPILGHEQEHRGNETTTTSTRPIEIKVAGRTDAGVSAIGQICRVRTWRLQPSLENGKSIEQFLKDYVNVHVAKNMRDNAPPLCVRSVECVDDAFHPTFGASCRAYAYLIDVNKLGKIERKDCWNEDEAAGEDGRCDHIIVQLSASTLVQRLNAMLRAMEGKKLDYIALSYGKVKSQTTLCTLHRARAHLVEWTGPSDGDEKPQRAICIELVGDRFLRRMVRILVATAMREANRDVFGISAEVDDVDDECHVGDDTLLNIVLSRDREDRARAAPPDGLIFIGAAY